LIIDGGDIVVTHQVSFWLFFLVFKFLCLVMWGYVHVLLEIQWARRLYGLGFDSPSSTCLLQACMQTTNFYLLFNATWDKMFLTIVHFE
jgi:hypothetical protein